MAVLVGPDPRHIAHHLQGELIERAEGGQITQLLLVTQIDPHGGMPQGQQQKQQAKGGEGDSFVALLPFGKGGAGQPAIGEQQRIGNKIDGHPAPRNLH